MISLLVGLLVLTAFLTVMHIIGKVAAFLDGSNIKSPDSIAVGIWVSVIAGAISLVAWFVGAAILGHP